MDVKDWLKEVAYIDDRETGFSEDPTCKAYKSKFDDSYITLVGMEDNVEFLADRLLKTDNVF